MVGQNINKNNPIARESLLFEKINKIKIENKFGTIRMADNFNKSKIFKLFFLFKNFIKRKATKLKIEKIPIKQIASIMAKSELQLGEVYKQNNARLPIE